MKRITYILLFASLLLPFALKAQTPYDSFAPEATRPMLEADALYEEIVRENRQVDTILCAALIDLQSQSIYLVSLTDEVQKWLSVDPLVDKNIATAPYMYCNGNPMRYIDPIGLDTLLFDKNGIFTERIKAEGEHVGIINNADGTKRNFRFLNQFDADCFCIEGSEEYDNLREQNIIPLKGIYQISAKTMNQLTASSISPWRYFPNYFKHAKMLYAGIASQKGGKMDYNRLGEPILNMAVNGQQMLYLAEGSNYAQDNYNFGNMLWGQAMRQLGISPVTSLLGAQFFSRFIDYRHEFDSWDDQYSILLGYFFCITRHF